MAKSQPFDEELLRVAVTTIKGCWEAGSPVAGSKNERWEQVARVGLRRIRSFQRRHVSPSDRFAQIQDLAQGLVQSFEPNSKLVGPLIEDYKHIASELLKAVQTFDKDHQEFDH